MASIAKFKVCRRLGPGVIDQCQTPRFDIAAARKGRPLRKHPPRKPSTYGLQLLEKQRLRVYYGIRERQLRNYVRHALARGRQGEQPHVVLFQLLERRLDTLVYRAGFAPTRRMARQLVSHGHFTVNGRRVTIPSMLLSVGDTFSVREGSRERRPFLALREDPPTVTPPAWLMVDLERLEGKVEGVPSLEGMELPFDLGQIVEFYSR